MHQLQQSAFMVLSASSICSKTLLLKAGAAKACIVALYLADMRMLLRVWFETLFMFVS